MTPTEWCVFTPEEEEFILSSYKKWRFKKRWWDDLDDRPALLDEVKYCLEDNGIYFYSRQEWSDWEDDLIRKYYPEHGAMWEEWKKLLPYGHWHSKKIRTHASVIGVSMKKGIWTEREKDLIRKYYPGNGAAWSGWERLLPSRNSLSIRQMAAKIGVKCTKAPQAVC